MSSISDLSQPEFERLFVRLHERIMENPIKNFVEAKNFIGVKLTPGQTVLFKLVMNYPLDNVSKHDCYEEIDPNDDAFFELRSCKMTEIELYEYFTGHKYDPEKINVIRDVSLIIGRRGGKTMCAAILAIYCCIKKNWKPMLGRKKVATILVMSHTTVFSDEIIEEVRAMIEESPVLSRLINLKAKNTQSTINLKIPFLNDKGSITYSYVRIRSNAASQKSTRGSACPAIIADEIAFWGSDPNAKETDADIVNAAKPSMLQFEDDAMWIDLSSPNLKQGVLYEKYEKRKEASKKSVVLKAPSWVFNNRYRGEDFWEYWKEDKINFDREYRANFTDSVSAFISSHFIDLAVLDNVKFQAPEDKKLGVTYTAAIDAAFKKDRFTFSIVGLHENRIKQYVSMGWEGTRLKPVSATQVAKFISKAQKEYGFDKVIADQYAFQPLREIFEQHQVVLEEASFTQPLKKKIYYNLRRLIHSQQLDLLDRKEQTDELKSLVAEQNTFGNIKIGHPQGGTDDFADSLASAVFVATEQEGGTKFTFEDSISTNTYGIKTDIEGNPFNAPSPEMVGQKMGTHVIDNSSEYVNDENTGKLRPLTEEDEDDGINFAI